MLILVAVLVLGVVANINCMVPSVKTTGGGWFTDDGHKVTFGFTAIPTGDSILNLGAKGQFQLIDHDTAPGAPNIDIHGEFDDVNMVRTDSEWTKFEGTCTVKGEEGEFDLEVEFKDEGEPGPGAGDYVKIKIKGWDGSGWDYQGALEGGNIQFHVPNEYRD